MDIACTQEPNDEKMRALILHISRQSEGDEPYGSTKLNKLLFYADFLSYRIYGQSITGHEYQALERGPSPRRLVPIRNEMEADGLIFMFVRDYYGYPQKRIVAVADPDLNLFTAREIALVDRLITQFWGMSASEISRLSHQLVWWESAEEHDEIPYCLALVGQREPTLDERKYGKELETIASTWITSQ